MNVSSPRTSAGTGRWTWCRRLGAVSFGLFLVKGLLWLAVPAALYLLQ